MREDPTAYWDREILDWESSCYGTAAMPRGVLGRLAHRLRAPVRARLARCGELLAPHVREQRVLELGCGSGLFCLRLLQAGAGAVAGIDLSARAIEAATARVREAGFADRGQFICGNVLERELPPADIVVGLGCLDWLTLDQIEALLRHVERKQFLFTFTEIRYTLFGIAHRLGRMRMPQLLGHSAYPRHYKAPDLVRRLPESERENAMILRYKELGIGAILVSKALAATGT